MESVLPDTRSSLVVVPSESGETGLVLAEIQKLQFSEKSNFKMYYVLRSMKPNYCYLNIIYMDLNSNSLICSVKTFPMRIEYA